MVGEFLDGGLGETAELDTSNMRPSTRAVSAMVSAWPMWEPSGPSRRCVRPDLAATSNAHSVRVDAFSKISAKFLPASPWARQPSCLARLSQAAVAR